MNNDGKKRSYMLRILVSTYLLYLAWGFIKDIGTAEQNMKTRLIIAGVFFGICGILFIASSAKGLYDMRSENSMNDVQEETEKDIEEVLEETVEEIDEDSKK